MRAVARYSAYGSGQPGNPAGADLAPASRLALSGLSSSADVPGRGAAWHGNSVRRAAAGHPPARGDAASRESRAPPGPISRRLVDSGSMDSEPNHGRAELGDGGELSASFLGPPKTHLLRTGTAGFVLAGPAPWFSQTDAEAARRAALERAKPRLYGRPAGAREEAATSAAVCQMPRLCHLDGPGHRSARAGRALGRRPIRCNWGPVCLENHCPPGRSDGRTGRRPGRGPRTRNWPSRSNRGSAQSRGLDGAAGASPPGPDLGRLALDPDGVGKGLTKGAQQHPARVNSTRPPQTN